MEIELDLKKGVDQNSSIYFEKAKKAKKKIKGAKIALESAQRKLEALKQKQAKELEKAELEEQISEKKERKKEWFEKFRWFVSSEGFLCVGGRDATTNEIVIKKHTDKEDVVFHTTLPGSPFFVIKTKGKKPGKATLEETAQATAVFSKAWKTGAAYTEVFWVKPEQVTKEAKAGEYVAKGAFMIYGKRNLMNPKMEISVGVDENNRVMCASETAVKKHCKKSVVLIQGREKASDTAKMIKKVINADVDDIIRVMPAGGAKIKK